MTLGPSPSLRAEAPPVAWPGFAGLGAHCTSLWKGPAVLEWETTRGFADGTSRPGSQEGPAVGETLVCSPEQQWRGVVLQGCGCGAVVGCAPQVLKWLKEEGSLEGVTVCDAGCGTGR